MIKPKYIRAAAYCVATAMLNSNGVYYCSKKDIEKEIGEKVRLRSVANAIIKLYDEQMIFTVWPQGSSIRIQLFANYLAQGYKEGGEQL